MLKHWHSLVTTMQLRLLCVKILVLLIWSVTSAYAQTNSISGDFSNYTADSTVDSNNSTESITNNYNAAGASSAAPVMSAISPTMMGGGGNDSCLMPTSAGVQLSIVGFSAGTMEQDPQCNTRKNARLLGTPQQIGGLGLQVSAISLMCGDAGVFKAMMLANTPCPIAEITTGQLLMGRAALNKYRESPDIYIVGYEQEKLFWDTLLRIGEDLDEQVEDTAPKLSLSERFRTSIR